MLNVVCKRSISKPIISNLLINNGYDPLAHNLRLEHAKNVGFDSKQSFCNAYLHGNTNSISNFLPKWYLFPHIYTYIEKNRAHSTTRFVRFARQLILSSMRIKHPCAHTTASVLHFSALFFFEAVHTIISPTPKGSLKRTVAPTHSITRDGGRDWRRSPGISLSDPS